LGGYGISSTFHNQSGAYLGDRYREASRMGRISLSPLLSYQVIVALLADNDLSDLEMIFVRVILVVVAV
jgi:hypothetical protein